MSISVSSNPPFFALRWLQNATNATPTLFINDINILFKGNRNGNQGNGSGNQGNGNGNQGNGNRNKRNGNGNQRNCSLDDFTNSNE